MVEIATNEAEFIHAHFQSNRARRCLRSKTWKAPCLLGPMIPAGEYFIRAPVTECLAKTNQAAGPAGAVSEDEIAGTESDSYLVEWRCQSFCLTIGKGPVHW
jgi:hypothetical protein